MLGRMGLGVNLKLEIHKTIDESNTMEIFRVSKYESIPP
jgi:hypothetical protein